MESSKVARLCYSEGFRDKNLITMVSIVSAESGYDENFTKDGKYGLFALRRTSPLDDVSKFLEPDYAAHVARSLYENQYFIPWQSYFLGYYLHHIRSAVEGVSEFWIASFQRNGN